LLGEGKKHKRPEGEGGNVKASKKVETGGGRAFLVIQKTDGGVGKKK